MEHIPALKVVKFVTNKLQYLDFAIPRLDLLL